MACRQTGSGFLKREIGDVERQPQLTVLGFNAGRIATVQNMGASNANPAQADQVNILNLPLPEADTEEGECPLGPNLPPLGKTAGSNPIGRASEHNTSPQLQKLNELWLVVVPDPTQYSSRHRDSWGQQTDLFVSQLMACFAGTMSEAEVPPQGVEVDPSLPGNPPVAAAAPTANSTPPPGVEAALQALDSAFASAPLPMTGLPVLRL